MTYSKCFYWIFILKVIASIGGCWRRDLKCYFGIMFEYYITGSYSMWKFKEIGQIDVGNVNKFKVRLRLFSKKYFRKNFIWVTKNLIFFRTEFYYFNSIIRPCHSKCQNFLVRIKNWIIFRWSFCFLASTTGALVQKQKNFRYPSHEWKPLGYLYCMTEENSSEKRNKKCGKFLHWVFHFFTTSKR